MTARRPHLTAMGALRAGDAATAELADAMRRCPDTATRAMLLNRVLAALQPLAPCPDIRDELAFTRRLTAPLILPSYRCPAPLAKAYPSLRTLPARGQA